MLRARVVPVSLGVLTILLCVALVVACAPRNQPESEGQPFEVRVNPATDVQLLKNAVILLARHFNEWQMVEARTVITDASAPNLDQPSVLPTIIEEPPAAPRILTTTQTAYLRFDYLHEYYDNTTDPPQRCEDQYAVHVVFGPLHEGVEVQATVSVPTNPNHEDPSHCRNLPTAVKTFAFEPGRFVQFELTTPGWAFIQTGINASRPRGRTRRLAAGARGTEYFLYWGPAMNGNNPMEEVERAVLWSNGRVTGSSVGTELETWGIPPATFADTIVIAAANPPPGIVRSYTQAVGATYASEIALANDDFKTFLNELLNTRVSRVLIQDLPAPPETGEE